MPGSPSSSAPDSSSITQLLHRWSGGDKEALNQLVPKVYDELRRLAQAQMRHERPAHTLQGTALVHEAFLRLAEQRHVHWESRGQFYAWAAQLMRRILVDHARARTAGKRGHGQPALSLELLQDEAAEPASSDALLEILQLDQALQRMQRLDERQSRVVELRFFAGLSVDETADALDLSPATVKREWATARAWLLQAMGLPATTPTVGLP